MMHEATIRFNARLALPASLSRTVPLIRNTGQSGKNKLSSASLPTTKTIANINSGPGFPPLLSRKSTSRARFVPTRGIQTP